MDKKKLFPYLVVFLISIQTVLAGPLFDLLGDAFSGGISDFYNSYDSWIDFTIYLVIFISLVMGVFKERFGQKHTKAIAIAMGAALSFGLSSFSPRLVAKLGPIAFLIFIALFFYLIFASLKGGFENKLPAMALAYLLSILALVILDPDGKIRGLFQNVPGLDWLYDVALLLGVLASIALIGWLIYKGLNKLSNRSPTLNATTNPTRRPTTTTPTPTTTTTTTAEEIPKVKGHRKWWGGKKDSHPDLVAKKLKEDLARDQLQINHIEEAIDLLDKLLNNSNLSDEEKQKIISKISDFLTAVLQVDPSQDVIDLINERLVLMDRVNQNLDLSSIQINGTSLKEYISKLFNDKYVPDHGKQTIQSTIAGIQDKKNKLEKYKVQLTPYKGFFESRGPYFKRLAEQCLAEINSGELKVVPQHLNELLEVKKHLTKKAEQVKSLLDNSDFGFLLEDIANVYGSEDQMPDKSQASLNLFNIIKSVIHEAKMEKLKSYVNNFISNYSGGKTFENFLQWLAANGVNDPENYFGFSLDELRNFFDSNVTQQSVTSNSQGVYSTFFALAQRYVTEANTNKESINVDSYVRYMVKNGGQNFSYPELYSNHDVDEEDLKEILERASGVFQQKLKLSDLDEKWDELLEYLNSSREQIKRIRDQKKLDKNIQIALQEEENLVDLAEAIAKRKPQNIQKFREADKLAFKAGQIAHNLKDKY
jgi:hypothetical protein